MAGNPSDDAMKYGIIIALLAMIGCTRHPYDGYKAQNGIYYRLLEIGEEDKKCRCGDYVTANLKYTTTTDSVFFSGTRTFVLHPPAFQGAVEYGFMLLNKNDSAIFVIPVAGFFEKTLRIPIPACLSGCRDMKIAVRILDVQTPKEYIRDKESAPLKNHTAQETSLIRKYIAHAKIDATPDENGIYRVVQRAGTGDAVRKNRTVTVHYEGFFLDGTMFDSTRRRNAPFQFVYGQQQQMLSGLEKVIGMMCEGEKVVAILPSDQAFGSEGSSIGIVPPFTPLMFEIEVIAVE
ncbi:MAG: FKBP-type peptidyl-prolyl cis-trans isomerase [Bacteroidales bacterium]|jgi:peptidylprolyl isomerase|nr:FKBP-type peptidyl-prolyl cis-trans isomerase [Bacteroidales bacterium]